MAERFAPGQYDRLHHFISDGLWDAVPLKTELALQADRIVGALDAFLVIDDSGLPKKGDHSVGVAPQYASMLGKRANCQTLVSVTLARDEVPVPVYPSEQGRGISGAARGNVGSWRSMRTRSMMRFWRCYG